VRASPSMSLGALAASVALAGCGAGSKSANESTQPLTPEEMREYDVNEGRCHDDGGSVRDVGTIAAYCSFPARSNDFHLIESSHEKESAGEEE
jgi:hypothetical protein